MSQIPEDIMQAARKACDLCGVTPTSDMRIHAEHVAATAILAEREKAEKLADEMYLTGVHDAYALANRIGYQDFAERLLRETNEKAKRSGLRELKVSA